MAYTNLTSLTAWWQSALAHNPSHRLSARSRTTVSVPHKQPSPSAVVLSCKSSRYARGNHRCANHKQTRTKLRHSICPAAGEHIADVFDINSADTNQLQTALNRAIAAEDYTLASQLRDQLQHVLGTYIGTADWRQLGVPEWLADRVERMGFKYATGLPCVHAAKGAKGSCIAALCNACIHLYGAKGMFTSCLQLALCLHKAEQPASTMHLQNVSLRLFPEYGANHQADVMLSIAEVQKRAAGALQEGRDIMIQSQTGSGKTLAFLLPLMSALQYPPDLYPEDLKVQSSQHVLTQICVHVCVYIHLAS